MLMTTPETSLSQVSALTLITPIKQGFIPELPTVRYVDRLRTVLATVQDLINARQPTVPDAISTIHFARWVIIDNDQQLLFTSNFNGTLNNYLSDFTNLDYVAQGLDRIWSHCEEYPGADPRNFQRFEAWVRKYSVPTTCFYAATPDVTVRDVKWLQLFKSRYDEFVQRVQDEPACLSAAFTELQRQVLHIPQQLLDRQTVLEDLLQIQALFLGTWIHEPLAPLASKFAVLVLKFFEDLGAFPADDLVREARRQLATSLQGVLRDRSGTAAALELFELLGGSSIERGPEALEMLKHVLLDKEPSGNLNPLSKLLSKVFPATLVRA